MFTTIPDGAASSPAKAGIRCLAIVTATVTTDLNFLENYSMHLLDRVTTGMVNMVVTSIFILMFDWRLGVIFILGVLCSFLIFGRMQKKGEELTAKQRQVQAASVEATLEYVQGISVIKSFNMAEKNLSGIEKAYEKSMEASYALERDFATMNVAYSMVFRVAACAIILVSQIFALGGELDFSRLAVILIASFSIFNSVEVMGQMTAMIRSMEASLDRVERIKGEKNIDDGGGDISLKSYDCNSSKQNHSNHKPPPYMCFQILSWCMYRSEESNTSLRFRF